MTGPDPMTPLRAVATGNINLYTRPKVPNPEGGTSTVYSFSFQDEDPRSPFYGYEVLVPRADEGRILSEDEARTKYYRAPRGQRHYLGIFETPDQATAYASQLHEAYARGDYEVPLASSRRAVDSDQLAAGLTRVQQQGRFGLMPLSDLAPPRKGTR